MLQLIHVNKFALNIDFQPRQLFNIFVLLYVPLAAELFNITSLKI